MKKIFHIRTLLATLTVTLLVMCWNRGSDQAGLFGRLGDGITRVIYDKQIFISGEAPYDEIELEAKLPMQRSVLWWFFSRDAVESALLSDPRVSGVKLESCTWTSDPGCFDLSLSKREGRFLVELNDTPWLVSADGMFLSALPVTVDQYALITDDQGEPLTVVRGALFGNISPDVAQAHIQFLDRAARLIERKVHREVSRISVEANGDMRIEFRGYSGEVVFSSAEDLGNLRREVHRLALLLQRIGAEKRVDTIDLSFENLAVVKLRPLS